MKNTPSQKDFLKGIAEFQSHEKRDAMYKVAMRLVKDYWGKWDEVTDGLGVLLLTWNQALYRYGMFDFDKLEQFLRRFQNDINQFKRRTINTLDKNDEGKIKTLFDELLTALTSEGKDGKLRKSPVAVAKALHILAPNFFPLWDNAIADAYSCYWINSNNAATKYIDFCWKNKRLVEYIKGQNIHKDGNKSWLKLIDEYNYAKFTYKWIDQQG
jgi:hypothetical protein